MGLPHFGQDMALWEISSRQSGQYISMWGVAPFYRFLVIYVKLKAICKSPHMDGVIWQWLLAYFFQPRHPELDSGSK